LHGRLAQSPASFVCGGIRGRGDGMSARVERVVAEIVDWIREKVAEAGAVGTVVALSGGIDAAVTAALCQRACPRQTLGVIMPCHSHPDDEADARLHARQAGIPVVTIDLTPVYDTLLAGIEQAWRGPGAPPAHEEGPEIGRASC